MSSDWQATQKKEIGVLPPAREGRVLPIMTYTGGAPPERGTVFRLQVKKKVGVLQVEVYERVYSVCKKAQKG